MIILLDNGHGIDTAGKCSPDRRLREYDWTRRMVLLLGAMLIEEGIEVEYITPELNDVPLSTRTKRVNTLCAKYGTKNCLLISVHNNAAPPNDGAWHSANGFAVYVAPKCSAASCIFADIIWHQAESMKLLGNRAHNNPPYLRGNFAIVRDTKCPAVLTENLFQDNMHDVDFLLTRSGMETMAKLHLEAIKKYLKTV